MLARFIDFALNVILAVLLITVGFVLSILTHGLFMEWSWGFC